MMTDAEGRKEGRKDLKAFSIFQFRQYTLLRPEILLLTIVFNVPYSQDGVFENNTNFGKI